MPLLGAKSQIKNLIMLSVAASVMVVGCSEKTTSNEILDTTQAREIIAEYFEDVEFDRNVKADNYIGSKASVDVLGLYKGKWIAIRYGYGDLDQGTPSISPDIDYYLDIPKGNKRFIQSIMMISLKSARFNPVLSQVEDFGVMKPLGAVKGMLEVRFADSGICRVVDTYLNYASEFDLRSSGKNKFQMPVNKGFGLKEGKYNLLCDFSAKDGSRIDDIEAATFEVPHHNRPLYQGGFEDVYCEQGREIELKAIFVDAKGNKIEPVYYDEFGKKMDSSVYDCFSVGVYAVEAIATDEYASQSESHGATIYVYSIDEGLFPGMDHLPGRPARY